jgi:hypothetical protein
MFHCRFRVKCLGSPNRLLNLLCFGPILLLASSIQGCSSGTSSSSSPPATAPSINTQPTSQSAYIGATVTLSVAASGSAPLAYAWQLNGAAIPGAGSSSYTTPALTTLDNGDSFTVTVSNSAGSATSNAAKLTVTAQAPQISVQPPNVSVQIGQTANFSVTAAGTAPLSYQWLRNNQAISAATSPTYALANAQSTDSGATFAVTVSNSAGSITSGPASLTVTQVPVALATQPAGGTYFVGETTTMSVSASGTSPNYQWTKNGTSIAGATRSSYTPPAFAAGDDNTSYAVIVSNNASSVTSSAAVIHVGPFATTYTTQQGAKLSLYAWPGSKMAILTGSNTLSPAVMRQALTAADGTWNYYAGATGALPSYYFTYNGLATIAEVQASCGAGCTYLGATGMEMSDPYFLWLPDGIPFGVYDQIIFYEMGRSFWLFENRIGYVSPGNSACLQTGYAVLMRFRSLAALNYQGGYNEFYSTTPTAAQAQAGANTYNALVASNAGMIDTYAANTSLTWQNTFLVNTFSNPNGGCADLFASMVQRLALNYGGEAFIQDLWKEVLKQPISGTNQDAADHFVLAASAAAKKNLTSVFINTWRWPVSAAAITAAQMTWGNPI